LLLGDDGSQSDNCLHRRTSDLYLAYDGAVGDTGQPLADARLDLYGYYSPDEEAAHLRSYTTGLDGWFFLITARAYPYYVVQETDPPRYASAGAISDKAGIVVDANHIRLDAPEPGYYIKSGCFDARPTPTPTITETSRSTATPTRTPTASATPSAMPTGTPTGTATTTGTATRTATPAATATSTPSATPSPTPTTQSAPPSIQGYVWRHDNRDGNRDPGQMGLPRWLVTVDSGPAQGWTLQGRQALTDAAGHYRFVDLAAGVHVVTVNDLQRHWPTTSCRSRYRRQNSTQCR